MLDYNSICWKDIVYYDKTSPTSLRWISNRANGKVKANSPAGSLHHAGYSTVNYFNKQYQGHRIVWILHYGSIDNSLFVDHIDGNRNNNSIDNLRLVTRAENCRNNEYLGSNTGVKGVSYQYRDDVYVAFWVDLNKKQIRLLFSHYYLLAIFCAY
jgi:hypothetical protein